MVGCYYVMLKLPNTHAEGKEKRTIGGNEDIEVDALWITVRRPGCLLLLKVSNLSVLTVSIEHSFHHKRQLTSLNKSRKHCLLTMTRQNTTQKFKSKNMTPSAAGGGAESGGVAWALRGEGVVVGVATARVFAWSLSILNDFKPTRPQISEIWCHRDPRRRDGPSVSGETCGGVPLELS